jgi:hypothetical protein
MIVITPEFVLAVSLLLPGVARVVWSFRRKP